MPIKYYERNVYINIARSVYAYVHGCLQIEVNTECDTETGDQEYFGARYICVYIVFYIEFGVYRSNVTNILYRVKHNFRNFFVG